MVGLAPGSPPFVQGQDRIVGLRLTTKGLFRWYTRCCHTPVGNTVSASIPFVGVAVQAFDTDAQTPMTRSASRSAPSWESMRSAIRRRPRKA